MQIESILFPTDFSASSLVASRFAASIAETFYAKLVLVYFAGETKSPEKFSTEEKKSIWKQLDELKLKILQKNPLINITGVVLESNSGEGLIDLASHENSDLILISGKEMEKVSSSYNGDLFTDAPCPVLEIPESGRFNGLKKVVYASDLDHIDITAIRELTQFASFYNSEVTILNISDHTKRFSEEELFKFEKKVRETCYYPKLDFIYFHGMNTHYHIQEYLERTKPDLFVVTSIKNSLVTKMMESKKIKPLRFESYLPKLTFHETDNCCQQVGDLKR
jgi:nucleotide-binding universal stress UspA family protein